MSVLLLNTGNYAWATMGILLLALQFVVVHLRVLPYLQSTFGSTSTLYLTFVVFGFPSGLLVLDLVLRRRISNSHHLPSNLSTVDPQLMVVVLTRSPRAHTPVESLVELYTHAVVLARS